jgi:hypothetical protein
VQVVPDIPVWNPYPYFGLDDAWPRGYPWNYIRSKPHPYNYQAGQRTCQPVIQQYLANLDPDVDAIYRLTKKLPVDFMSQELTAVALPRNVFSPYNAQVSSSR